MQAANVTLQEIKQYADQLKRERNWRYILMHPEMGDEVIHESRSMLSYSCLCSVRELRIIMCEIIYLVVFFFARSLQRPIVFSLPILRGHQSRSLKRPLKWNLTLNSSYIFLPVLSNSFLCHLPRRWFLLLRDFGGGPWIGETPCTALWHQNPLHLVADSVRLVC